MIDFTRNHFELFGLPLRFRIDVPALRRAYRDLQREVHPDRYAGGSEHEKRLALQASARVNEAYRTLEDPVARAEYLLQLAGIDATAETDTRLPIDFLTRQLERREAADEARSAHDERALAAILDDVRRESGALLADMEDVLAGDDREPARMRVRELRFLAKLDDDLREMQLAELDR
ncbi:MAG: Fe-S protein assembly co-chaperone HscB [Betaproteobacteria bacterium]|nr:Fe-S protein assembly co-chaperone HscB [Betaproteobacteria bacterium]